MELDVKTKRSESAGIDEFAVVELEERLEMTAVAVGAEGPIEIGAEIGADHNGPNGKITLKWIL
ncbi:MAG: hypothetical protein SOW44_07925 [Porphyromonas sp.]|nr:hypothetical protein [Bacteroidales bacterium]MDY3101249.1 hypothetical protein [Porphyromonas sp.]